MLDFRSGMSKITLIVLIALGSICCSSAEVCDAYIKVSNRFPDGYRGIMNVPVLAAQNGWNLLLQFDKNVKTLDVPNANIQNGIKNGSRFILTHLRHNMHLPAGRNLTQEFVVHFTRNERPTPKINRMQLGEFACEPAREIDNTDQNSPGQCVSNMPAPQIPDCIDNSRIVSQWSEGFKVELSIPVQRAVPAWKMVIFFGSPVMVLTFPHGNILTNRNNTEFIIGNKDYNARLQAGKVFKVELTVRYFRSSNARIQGIIFDPARYICGSQQFGKKMSERYSREGLIVAQKHNSFARICEDDLRYLSRFPDGFREEFKMPVTRDMNGWKVRIEFDAYVRVLDVPDADIDGGSKSGKVFILKNKRHNSNLRKGTTLRIEFTVHYQRGLKLKIKNVRFDTYSCEAAEEDTCDNIMPIGADWLTCPEPTTPPPHPDCSKFFKRSTLWPDGEQGVIQIPIKESKNGWNVTVRFDKKISVFDVTQADKVEEKDGILFVFRNKVFNARLKSGVVFNFGVTMHYRRGLNPRPKISLVKFDNDVVCLGV